MTMTVEAMFLLLAMLVVRARPMMDPDLYVMEFESQRLPGDCMDYICQMEEKETTLGKNTLHLRSLSEKFLITIPLCVKHNKIPSGVALKIKTMQLAGNTTVQVDKVGADGSGGVKQRDDNNAGTDGGGGNKRRDAGTDANVGGNNDNTGVNGDAENVGGEDYRGVFLGEKNLIIEQDTTELWNIFHEWQPVGDYEEYKLLLTIQTDAFGTEVDKATVETMTEEDAEGLFCEMANNVRVQRAND